jgi:hypothetical protein
MVANEVVVVVMMADSADEDEYKSLLDTKDEMLEKERYI